MWQWLFVYLSSLWYLLQLQMAYYTPPPFSCIPSGKLTNAHQYMSSGSPSGSRSNACGSVTSCWLIPWDKVCLMGLPRFSSLWRGSATHSTNTASAAGWRKSLGVCKLKMSDRVNMVDCMHSENLSLEFWRSCHAWLLAHDARGKRTMRWASGEAEGGGVTKPCSSSGPAAELQGRFRALRRACASLLKTIIWHFYSQLNPFRMCPLAE